LGGLPRRSLLAACLCVPLQALQAQGAGEADLKAALVYNFAQFTEWEEREPAAAGRPFTICYAGAEMTAAFAQIAARSIRERSVVPRPIPAEGPYEGCQVVYWHLSHAQRALPAKAGYGVLTVGNGVEFLARGGMIETHVEDSRFVFSINQESAHAAGLRFSSKLLRLAKGVLDKPR
jgi:hypothetical protein